MAGCATKKSTLSIEVVIKVLVIVSLPENGASKLRFNIDTR